MHPRRPRIAAFTLVEIMIVVVIIGLLAALAIPAMQRLQRKARNARYLNDVRVLRDAAELFAQERGNYPPNGVAGLHTDLTGYIPARLFTETTPLGGVWDWDYQQSGITAAVSVWQPTATASQILELDRQIDDGNINTGLLRHTGSKVIYILVQ